MRLQDNAFVMSRGKTEISRVSLLSIAGEKLTHFWRVHQTLVAMRVNVQSLFNCCIAILDHRNRRFAAWFKFGSAAPDDVNLIAANHLFRSKPPRRIDLNSKLGG